MHPWTLRYCTLFMYRCMQPMLYDLHISTNYRGWLGCCLNYHFRYTPRHDTNNLNGLYIIDYWSNINTARRGQLSQNDLMNCVRQIAQTLCHIQRTTLLHNYCFVRVMSTDGLFAVNMIPRYFGERIFRVCSTERNTWQIKSISHMR